MNFKTADEKSIFNIAANIACVDARRAYLEQACADRPEMRQRIEVLLRMQDEEPDFLERSAETQPTNELETDDMEVPGNPIGPYKLLEVIGEGGMGSVYMAKQTEPVNRRVALKLIKTGMDTQQVIARFEAERQTLAMMDHPNIAKVFDAGTTATGRPYFVMELVKGKSITKFCDEQQLDLESRLRLFQKVCHAVQHAHQKGIIHRDIKPSNVLVAMYDDRPVPKVIDFGVAKATGDELTEKTMFTRFGQIVGTLEYMSPEQAQFNQLDIDTRSDIYSLGAILYELLAGEPPFEREKIKNQALDETLRMIREDEPTKPSTKLSGTARSAQVASNRKTSWEKLGSILRGDLDWIVMKALDKDRTRRYETANGFAMDVGRYLADEPVSATPPSAAYRFSKFAKRNKAKIAAISTIASLVIIGTGISAWQAIRATNAEADALRVAKRAVYAEQLARINEKEALQKSAIATAVRDFLNNRVLAEASPSKQLDPNITLREVLDQAAKHIDKELADQPLVKAEIHTTISDSYVQLGKYEQALHHIEMADSLFEAEVGGDDIRSLSAKSKLGYLLIRLDRGQTAQDLLENSYTSAKDLFPVDPVTFEIAHTLAIAYKTSRRFDESRVLFQSVLEHRLDHYGAEDRRTLGTRNNLAIVLLSEGRFEEAEKAFLQVRDVAAKVLPDSHPVRRKTMVGLAKTYEVMGKRELAEQMQREAVRISTSMYGRENVITAREIYDLAITLNRRGKHTEAIALLNPIADFLRANIKEDAQDWGSRDRIGLNCEVHEELSNAHNALWEYKEAFDCLLSAYEDSKRVLGQTDGTTIRLLSKMINAAKKAEKFRGLDLHVVDDVDRQIEELTKASDKLESPERESVKWYVGLLAMNNEQPEIAQQVFQELIDLMESGQVSPIKRDRSGFRLAGARCNLGNALRQRDAFEEAVKVYVTARNELELALENNPDEATARRFLLNTLLGLATSYTELGERTNAMATWDAVIANAPEARRVNYEISKADATARLGDHLLASERLELLVERQLPGKNLLNLAIGFCLCSTAVENDESLDTANRHSLANQYKAKAIALLKGAVADMESLEKAYGLSRVLEELDSNDDFKPIRDEPEFNAIVDEVKSRLKEKRNAIQQG